MKKRGLVATPLASSLALAGWKFEGEKPPEKKYVCLAWPHTSNWDGLLLIALTQSIGLSMSWMIKNDWVKGPMGVVLKRMGAVAIDRSGAHNVVQDMIDAFAKDDELVLVIPPEGTRRRSDYWKSGFYHIARGANVPVVPGWLDYGRKRAGLGPAIHLTGDVKKDMDAIRAFYETIHAKGLVPENVGPMRLRDEDPKPKSP
jgi:1-acyl-sn-glycerol-3-phosphate acyltransferase